LGYKVCFSPTLLSFLVHIKSFFSTYIKCLFEACGQEMHPNWWLLSKVKKPYVGEKVMLRND
jgi:hypothetical protein